MQAITRMAQHLMHPAPVEAFQALAELLAHHGGRWPLLAWLRGVVLVDVVVLKAPERLNRRIKTGCRHAPGTYRRTDKMNRMGCVRQPVTKNEAAKRTLDQPLRSAGCARHDGNIPGLQATLFNVP